MKSNKCIGSSLDSFLEEEGILQECEKSARERIEKWMEDKKEYDTTDHKRL